MNHYEMFTEEEFKSAAFKDILKLKCCNCSEILNKTKAYCYTKRLNNIKNVYCSNKCQGEHASLLAGAHIYKCKTCLTNVKRINSRVKGNIFCSTKCAGIYNSSLTRGKSLPPAQREMISNTLKEYYKTHVYKRAAYDYTPEAIMKRTNAIRQKFGITVINGNIQKQMNCKFCGVSFTSIRKSGYYPIICSEKCRHEQRMKNANGNSYKYKGICMDSRWEVIYAEFLDKYNIKWVRPGPIEYTRTDNKTRRYYCDFFLPEYNLYVDPKNPLVITKQKEKLDILSKQINLKYGDINDLIRDTKKMAHISEVASEI